MRRGRGRPPADHPPSRSATPGSSSHGLRKPGVWAPWPGATSTSTLQPSLATGDRARVGTETKKRQVGFVESHKDRQPCSASGQSAQDERDAQSERRTHVRRRPSGDVSHTSKPVANGIGVNEQHPGGAFQRRGLLQVDAERLQQCGAGLLQRSCRSPPPTARVPPGRRPSPARAADRPRAPAAVRPARPRTPSARQPPPVRSGWPTSRSPTIGPTTTGPGSERPDQRAGGVHRFLLTADHHHEPRRPARRSAPAAWRAGRPAGSPRPSARCRRPARCPAPPRTWLGRSQPERRGPGQHALVRLAGEQRR